MCVNMLGKPQNQSEGIIVQISLPGFLLTDPCRPMYLMKLFIYQAKVRDTNVTFTPASVLPLLSLNYDASTMR